MKKVFLRVRSLLSLTALLVAGCATALPVGALYTKVDLPVTATSIERGSKVGMATSHSILNLIAMGNSSIDEAAKSAGITKVTHVDWHAESILGIFSMYTVTVYGD